MTKAESTDLRAKLAQAKDFDAMTDIVGEWTGEEEMKAIIKAIKDNPPLEHRMLPSSFLVEENESIEKATVTPPNTEHPDPPTSRAPLLPSNFDSEKAPAPLPSPAPTPTPGGGVTPAVAPV